MEIISATAFNNQYGRDLCEIAYTLQRPVEVNISIPHFGKLVEKGNTLFDALLKLRLQLERNGWFLLCNVARRDAYPSQMMLQMALGRKIYILKHGSPARREDIVDIFDEAALEQIGTVEEQREYHENWIKSLGLL